MIAGVILAGGHVWRADAFEALCPRALLPVANAPLITYVLAWLRAAGVTTVTICTNQDGRAVQAVLRDGASAGLDLCYYEDRVPRGPAGCLHDAAALADAEQFVVVDGSILPSPDLAGLLRQHAQSGADVSVVVSSQGRATDIPGAWLDPAGIYVFAGRVAAGVPIAGFQDIKEALLPRLHHEGTRVAALSTRQPSPRIRDRASYLAAQAWMLQRMFARELALEGYEWRDGACVHGSAQVAPRARLVGPVMIGPETCVSADAIVVGPAVIGSRCTLERWSAVTCATLWDACRLGEHAVVDHCVLTTGFTLAPGAARHGLTCTVDGEEAHAARAAVGV